MQERNTARLSERLTLAEEAAALARADAAESSAALSALRAENAAHKEGGSELHAQLTSLLARMNELQGLADAAKEEAGAASHAVAVAAAREVKLSREQVCQTPHCLTLPAVIAVCPVRVGPLCRHNSRVVQMRCDWLLFVCR